jgi:hypothetical protein
MRGGLLVLCTPAISTQLRPAALECVVVAAPRIRDGFLAGDLESDAPASLDELEDRGPQVIAGPLLRDADREPSIALHPDDAVALAVVQRVEQCVLCLRTRAERLIPVGADVTVVRPGAEDPIRCQSGDLIDSELARSPYSVHCQSCRAHARQTRWLSKKLVTPGMSST